jgi:hypothetical protein
MVRLTVSGTGERINRRGNAERSDTPLNDEEKSMALFELGKVVATPAALEVLQAAQQAPAEFLQRHANGDLGQVDEHDAKANAQALLDEARILSSYQTSKGETIWIITEADRSSTCVLLPSDY